MVLVRKGNVYLDIDDEDKQRYLNLGYDILDKDGNLVERSIPQDVGELRVAFTKHLEEIKQLKETISKLQKELAKLNPEKEKRQNRKK